VSPPKPPKKRKRVLSDSELKLAMISARSLGSVFSQCFMLLAITGQRRSEVAELDWLELNRQERIWTLPEERCKNGVTHLVPLSDMAVELLDQLAGVTDHKKHVWPSKGLVFTTTGRTPISGSTIFGARWQLVSRNLAVGSKLPKPPSTIFRA